MTALESLQALSDAELIERLAIEVMGWKKWYWDEPAHGRAWGWVSAKHYESHRDKRKCDAYPGWNPVGDYEYLGTSVKADWNHTMEVVKQCDKKGFVRETDLIAFQRAISFRDQRAICLAALLATSPS